MSRNVHQVYQDNPSTVLPGSALIYVGLSPYNTSGNSAIAYQDLETQIGGLLLPYKQALGVPPAGTISGGPYVTIANDGKSFIVPSGTFAFTVTSGGLTFNAPAGSIIFNAFGGSVFPTAADFDSVTHFSDVANFYNSANAALHFSIAVDGSGNAQFTNGAGINQYVFDKTMSVSNNKISLLASGVASTDAVNKGQLDSVAASILPYQQAIGVPAAGTISGGPYVEVDDAGRLFIVGGRPLVFSPDGTLSYGATLSSDGSSNFTIDVASDINLIAAHHVQITGTGLFSSDIAGDIYLNATGSGRSINTNSDGDTLINTNGIGGGDIQLNPASSFKVKLGQDLDAQSNNIIGINDITINDKIILVSGGGNAFIEALGFGDLKFYSNSRTTESFGITSTNDFNFNSNSNLVSAGFRINDAGYYEYYGGNTTSAPRFNDFNLNANAILSFGANKQFVTTQLTDGQLMIGSTGVAPNAATLTAGTNISITNTAGQITIAATGSSGQSYVDTTVNFNTGGGSTTETIRFMKTGNLVTAFISNFSGVIGLTGGTLATATGASPAPIPAGYVPDSGCVSSCLVATGAVVSAQGKIVFGVDGNITIYLTPNNGNFPYTGGSTELLFGDLGGSSRQQQFQWFST